MVCPSGELVYDQLPPCGRRPARIRRAAAGRSSDNYTVMSASFGIEMMSPSGRTWKNDDDSDPRASERDTHDHRRTRASLTLTAAPSSDRLPCFYPTEAWRSTEFRTVACSCIRRNTKWFYYSGGCATIKRWSSSVLRLWLFYLFRNSKLTVVQYDIWGSDSP